VQPSSKRPARFYEPNRELAALVDPDASRAPAAHDAEFPGPRERDAADDDPTLFYGASHASILPPRPDTPVPQPRVGKAPRVPSLRGGMRIPQRLESQRGAVLPTADEEDRTILRPTPEGLLLRTSPSSAPPAPEGRGKRPAGRRLERASDVGDPPSAVITARSRITRPDSTKSVAAALVTMGAFVGLVTAAIARGDADGLLDATASLVGSDHSNTARPAAAVTPFPEVTALPAANPKAPALGTDQNPAPGACLAAAETTATAAPAPAAPVPSTRASARAAPAWEPVAIARASASRPTTGTHSASRPASPSAGGTAASASNGGGSSHSSKGAKPAPSAPEYESAAAADALAKAQLEASLR